MMRRLSRRLVHNESGVAAVEFALSLPILIPLVMGGAELANFAYTRQRLADLATQTADNISRFPQSISEDQITDALSGMKIMTDNIDFRNRGRIIVSSEMPVVNGSGTVTDQAIRWQRCTGAKNVASSYGTPAANVGIDGMGPAGRKIATVAGTETIFVEIRYDYRPLISAAYFGAPTMSAVSAMLVRDRNGDTQNAPTGTVTSACTTFAA